MSHKACCDTAYDTCTPYTFSKSSTPSVPLHLGGWKCDDFLGCILRGPGRIRYRVPLPLLVFPKVTINRADNTMPWVGSQTTRTLVSCREFQRQQETTLLLFCECLLLSFPSQLSLDNRITGTQGNTFWMQGICFLIDLLVFLCPGLTSFFGKTAWRAQCTWNGQSHLQIKDDNHEWLSSKCLLQKFFQGEKYFLTLNTRHGDSCAVHLTTGYRVS